MQQLHRDACDAERWNRLHPDEPPRVPWIGQCLTDPVATYVVSSDYHRALIGTIARWLPSPPVLLGADGFGRSDSRGALRRFFEVDVAQMAYSAISDLACRGLISVETALESRRELQIDPEKPNSANG